MSENDSSSIHLSKDSTLRLMIVVRRDYENIQTATVSIYDLLSKARSIRRFSVNEIEAMFDGLKSNSDRLNFMTENGFLGFPNDLYSYYQTSPTKEAMVINWRDALADGDMEWLKLSFSSEQTFNEYDDRFISSGYQGTSGIRFEFKKAKFVLTLNRQDQTIRLTRTPS